MEIVSFTPWAVEGLLVDIDLEIRRGIPGMDIIGLPEGAVREARERIRSAIVKSGFDYPKGRILVNMAPADIKKAHAHHDLSVCLALLLKTSQIQGMNKKVMVLGELQLNGKVRCVQGVLAAILKGLEEGIQDFIVPEKNRREAMAAPNGRIWFMSDIKESLDIVNSIQQGSVPVHNAEHKPQVSPYPNLSDFKGQPLVKRALMIAAAGGHNLLLFGPPGSGKTMAAERLGSLYGPLSPSQALNTSRIWSISGLLNTESGLIHYPVMRTPHHSASFEGMVGGGRFLEPGEVSLAHNGMLFLDEAPEFSSRILQGLREPLESGRIALTRAGKKIVFPADFQLILTANPCPCGNLGRDGAVCVCSRQEVVKYWKKMGGALLDRVDIRLPVAPVSAAILLEEEKQDSEDYKQIVGMAKARQSARFKDFSFQTNSRIPARYLNDFCPLNDESSRTLIKAVEKLKISSRAVHSILRMSLTIADLEQKEYVENEHILESIQFRRYGDNDLFWMKF